MQGKPVNPQEVCHINLITDDDEVIVKAQEENDESENIDFQMYASKCTDCQWDLKPNLYPEEFWPYLYDEWKPRVMQAWVGYDEDRIKEKLLPQMLQCDISNENPQRSREAPYVRAFVLAVMDLWFHRDENNPGTVVGHKPILELKDPENKEPVVMKQKRMSPLERASLTMRIKGMLRVGRIVPSKSQWSHAIRMVPNSDRIQSYYKKHGDDSFKNLYDKANESEVKDLCRMTGDFRLLNNRLVLQQFPLPNIKDIINRMNNKSRYSNSDAEDAFFMLLLDVASRYLTAFSTPDGHYEYTVMPQGIHLSAGAWSRVVAKVFEDIKDDDFALYVDDVVNFASLFSQHMFLWMRMADIARPSNLKFKLSKTHLNYTSQKILGQVVSKEGRRADPGLIKDILKIGVPCDVTGVRSLIGLAQVAREYIPRLSTLLEPLLRITKMSGKVDVREVWGEEQEKALGYIKHIITSEPVLLLPDCTKIFQVRVDSCKNGRGIGAILLQQGPTQAWQPVAYWSRVLSSSERKYAATALEATGMHDSILHWRQFLQNGIPFELITDHYALVWLVLKIGGDANGRLTRLILDLQQFVFSVKHSKGSQHFDADAVSRLLQIGDEPIMHTEEMLRDDEGPLTESDKEIIRMQQSQEYERIVEIVDEFRKERAIDIAEEAKQSPKGIKAVTTVRPSESSQVSMKPEGVDRFARLNQQEWEQFDKEEMEGISHIEDSLCMLSKKEMDYIKTVISDEGLAMNVVNIINAHRADVAMASVFHLRQNESDIPFEGVFIHSLNDDDVGMDDVMEMEEVHSS